MPGLGSQLCQVTGRQLKPDPTHLELALCDWYHFDLEQPQHKRILALFKMPGAPCAFCDSCDTSSVGTCLRPHLGTKPMPLVFVLDGDGSVNPASFGMSTCRTCGETFSHLDLKTVKRLPLGILARLGVDAQGTNGSFLATLRLTRGARFDLINGEGVDNISTKLNQLASLRATDLLEAFVE